MRNMRFSTNLQYATKNTCTQTPSILMKICQKASYIKPNNWLNEQFPKNIIFDYTVNNAKYAIFDKSIIYN